MENDFRSEKVKKVLLAVGAFLTIFLALKSWEVIRELSAPRIDRPSISIMGEGKVFIKPDIGQVYLGVITEATTVADAQKKATDAINKVIEALKAKGVEEKDIKTTNYSINPKYGYERGALVPVPTPAPMPVPGSMYPESVYLPYPPDPKITGYTVSQNLDVKIRDLNKAGEILSAAAAAGANQVGGVSFTTEDPSVIQAEARTKAIEDAEKKARELEDKLGINLGKIINFYESGGPYPIYRDYAMGKGGEASVAPAAPSLPIGENEVVVNVTVTYQVK